MTHPTDEELDALVGMLQQRDKSKHGYTGHPLYNRNGSQAAAVITALRAQLAEVQADLTFMTESRNKWQDSATQRWFRLEEANARADRAEAERDVWEIDAKRNHQAAEIEFARADRAESERAAQDWQPIETAPTDDDAEFLVWDGCNWYQAIIGWRGRPVITTTDYRPILGLTHWRNIIGPAQPHDRTALDRMLRAEREKALREAAEYVGKASNTFPDNTAWAVEDLAHGITAMIEQPAPEMPIMSGDATGR